MFLDLALILIQYAAALCTTSIVISSIITYLYPFILLHLPYRGVALSASALQGGCVFAAHS